jgi:E3 ubiquitin-protein ligase BRE1
MAGHVVSSSPTQPPLKIQKFEVNHDEAPSSSELSHPSPRPVEPIVISSSEPVPDSTPPVQQLAEKHSTHVISGSSSLPSSPIPISSSQGAANPSKTKYSMKRQRPNPAASDFDGDDDDDGADKSAFFLKHQNAALASELQQLRYQLKLLERERDFRRNQCQDACQLLHSLEATWNAMEVALQLGQQPQEEREEVSTIFPKSSVPFSLTDDLTYLGKMELERHNTVTDDTPRSTGTGESVELIGALLDSLARIGKESLPVDGSDDQIQLRDIHQTADSVSKRATALQRWIWGLLRKITSEDNSGKHPLLKLAKLEAKLSALKAQVQNFQIQITELAKCRDDAVESERRVRRGLYRLNAGRMKLDEVLKAIETDGRDGSDALMAMEENTPLPAAESHPEEDDDVVDSSQIAQLRKQIRDLEEISSSREKQIAEVRASYHLSLSRSMKSSYKSSYKKAHGAKRRESKTDQCPGFTIRRGQGIE